jgi:hypothetical protein
MPNSLVKDCFIIALGIAPRSLIRFTDTVIPWRGGRVVEGAALEMLFGGNFNEGSNPSLSVLQTSYNLGF